MKPGVHNVKAIQTVLSEGDKGEYIAVKFARTDDASDVINWFGFFGDKVDKGGKTQMERTTDAMKAAGWKGDWNDFSSIGSCECEIVVVEDEWQGQKQIKVRFVQPKGTAASFMPQAIDADKAKRFAQRMERRTNPKASDDEDPPF